MEKFKKNLTENNEGIKAKRADALAKDVEREQNQLILNLERDVDSYKSKLDKLNDLGPTNADDLTVGGSNFNAADYVKEIQNTKVTLEIRERELKIAKQTLVEWRGEQTQS